jgi:pilus assembly protein Flp/PilA
MVSNCFLTSGASAMKNLLTRFVKDESGVTAIEYGLIAALISVVCIAAMTFAGQQLLLVYQNIGNALAGAL